MYPPIRFLNDKLTFGQHKGETIESVIRNDAGYIVWLKEKNICEVDIMIFVDAKKRYSHRYDDLVDDRPDND